MLNTLDHLGVDQMVIFILFGINKWMILGHELERETRGREREVQRYLTVSLGGGVRRGSHRGAGGEVVDVQWW